VLVPVILSRIVPRPVLVRVRAFSAVGMRVAAGVLVLVRVAVLRAVRVRVLVGVLMRVEGLETRPLFQTISAA
jgi:hypothetical protein